MMKKFFGGIASTAFKDRCREFAYQVLPRVLREDALDEIRRLKQLDVRIIVVSASVEDWVKPWCDTLELECIGTRLKVAKGKITGKIDGFNCYGQEKVNRILHLVDLSDYSDIYAYGDSKGDIPMLELASISYYKMFKR